MKRSIFSVTHSSLFALALAALVPACGGGAASEPPAAAPPPPPPPAAPVAEAPPPPPPAPAPVEAPPPPPEAKRPHHHGEAGMVIAGIDSLELKPEQKATTDAIKAELAKLGEGHKELGQKLVEDVADGVAAGKIDKKKTDADVKALVASMQATTAPMQDAAKKLHDTLDADQRKKFVAFMHEMGMHEHGDHEHGDHEHGDHEHGDHEHGDHEHGGPGGMHEHGGPGGPPGAPPPAMGPGGAPPPPPAAGPGAPPPGGPGMHEHGDHEHGDHEHMGMEHGMEGHLEMLSKELALTPEQTDKLKKKFEADMKAKEGTMKAKKAEMEKKAKAVGDAFESDKFDPKKVGIGTRGPEMAKEMATMKIGMAETVLAVLTPEQRAKFAAHLKEHAADMD